MADTKQVRRTFTTDLGGMVHGDEAEGKLPARPGANSGKRAVDDNGVLIPREFNKTVDDGVEEDRNPRNKDAVQQHLANQRKWEQTWQESQENPPLAQASPDKSE